MGNMTRNRRTLFLLVALILIAAAAMFIRSREHTTIVAGEIPPTASTVTVLAPQTISIPDSPLRDSVIAAGDFLVRQQLPNGELSYQVEIFTDARGYSPSYIRLIAGTGSLYTVCRVSGDTKYCDAGDLALNHYISRIIVDETRFTGACFNSDDTCQLGGSALAIDAIYKRWQATGSLELDGNNLSGLAQNLGYFILSMRKPEGGFYHSFDPHYGGTADPDYFVIYFPGESLLALTELYEMTGNEFWLEQAREVNDYMITQPVTEDHWHSYAFSMFARLDKLTKADLDYAKQIADTVIAGEVRSLSQKNTSISSATKIESLAALGQAFLRSDEEHEWLDSEIRAFITFVRARQLPDHNCPWSVSEEMTEKFGGGIFSSCEDPSVRIDGLQHYINGITAYLEYQSLIEQNK
jgi:hypothetical protein